MDFKRILYAFSPRVTAGILALVISLSVTLAASKIYAELNMEQTNNSEDGQQVDSENQAENEGSQAPTKEDLVYKDAPGVGAAVSAKGALICRLDDGVVLAQKSLKDTTVMGQLSIFMTAILASKAINDKIISLDDEAVCPASAAKSPGYTLSSGILPIGKRMKIEDILKCLFYQSGSSYAYTLAVHISGSVEAFTNKMNEYAVQIGMRNTCFDNCAGDISEKSVTNAYDTAVLLKHLMKDELLKKIICSNDLISLDMGYNSSVTLTVKNEFFSKYATDSQAKSDGLVGGKVCVLGYNQSAIVLFLHSGYTYLSVTLNSQDAFSDALILYSAYVLS